MGHGTAWWRLPETAEFTYLWHNLTYHLKEAGLEPELDQVCCDLRFLAMRLRRSVPAAVEADLARSTTPTAARLRRAIGQNAHLLGPIEPAAALTTILTSRLDTVPEVAGQLAALRSDLHTWTAWPVWPRPDQPSDALTRTLTGHTRSVNAVAIAPDGTWLASGSGDQTVRIWAADGTPRATLTGHTDWVNAVAIAPDGTWLASGSGDGTIRIWASADATKVHSVTAIRVDGAVWACAWLPEGAEVCIAGDRGIYRFSLCPPEG